MRPFHRSFSLAGWLAWCALVGCTSQPAAESAQALRPNPGGQLPSPRYTRLEMALENDVPAPGGDTPHVAWFHAAVVRAVEAGSVALFASDTARQPLADTASPPLPTQTSHYLWRLEWHWTGERPYPEPRLLRLAPAAPLERGGVSLGLLPAFWLRYADFKAAVGIERESDWRQYWTQWLVQRLQPRPARGRDTLYAFSREPLPPTTSLRIVRFGDDGHGWAQALRRAYAGDLFAGLFHRAVAGQLTAYRHAALKERIAPDSLRARAAVRRQIRYEPLPRKNPGMMRDTLVLEAYAPRERRMLAVREAWQPSEQASASPALEAVALLRTRTVEEVTLVEPVCWFRASELAQIMAPPRWYWLREALGLSLQRALTDRLPEAPFGRNTPLDSLQPSANAGQAAASAR